MRDAVQPLRREFDRLADEGRTVDLWWRDDDAVRDTAQLDRLLGTADAAGAPLALAVVPAAIEPSLAERVAGRRDLAILVHGLHHRDHAPSGQKSAEFGSHRPLPALVRDADEGLRRTIRAFGTATVPVFVPPWNRVAPALLPPLPRLGYRAVSAFGTPGSADAAPGLARLDTHLDPVAWRGTRSLVDPGQLASSFRKAAVAKHGPVGVLTHHLVFDEALWAFVEALLEVAAAHPAIRLRSVGEMIDAEPRVADGHSISEAIRRGSAQLEAAPT